MRYRMIAIDLDGTLMSHSGTISQENLDAIARAQDAGVLVVPCTGRVWRESWMALEKLSVSGPGVFVSGAVITDMANGQSLDLAVIEPHLAQELVRFLTHLPEAVLVCRDWAQCGHDYLVTGSGTLTPSTQHWFERTGATVHFQETVATDDLRHTLRVGVVADTNRVRPLIESIRSQFADRVMVHSFEAIRTPDPSQCVSVLEVFAAGVGKWRGVQLIAQQHGITPSQIAAIGDEINDVALIQEAGCGVAMGNAIDAVKAAADYHTLDCEHHGVAHAIDQLLAGAWDG